MYFTCTVVIVWFQPVTAGAQTLVGTAGVDTSVATPSVIHGTFIYI